MRYEKSEYFWINDMRPYMLMHPYKPELDGQDLANFKDPQGKKLFVEFVDTVKNQQEGFVHYLWPKPGMQQPVPKVSYVKGFTPWGWIIGSGIYIDDVEQIFRSRVKLFAAIMVGMIGVIGVLSWLLARGITRALAHMVTILQRAASGDLTARVQRQTHDELGQMGQALNLMLTSFHDSLTQVQQTAQQTATASQQLSAATEQFAAGAQQQASALEETAASLEQLTSTVERNAENAHQANQLAVNSRDAATQGGQVVSTAVAAMGGINASSKQIADIISVIDGIAFQTNLLALNAAVEAARAGEQGRGFAVVAAEVRHLAQRSAEAAKEIKGLIQNSVEKVQSGSELVHRSGQALDEIVGSVQHVTTIIAEIATASQEQSAGLVQVNRAVTQMDQVTQANAAQTEELTATAQALANQAGQLQTLVERFTLTLPTAGQAMEPAARLTAPHVRHTTAPSTSAAPALVGTY
jgi:methyl-accepting chemotaxis protein